MFVEKKVEGVIRDGLSVDLASVAGGSVNIRTFWAEPEPVQGQESGDALYPQVMLACNPATRETGHQSERELTLNVACLTHKNDDYNRVDLQDIYEAARSFLETADFDLGGNIIYENDSYEISDGSIGIDDSIQSASFVFTLKFCADAHSWEEN